jgi:hypothetical protein
VYRANDEIERYRHNNEKELTLMSAKLQKSDLKIKMLEKTIGQKQTENAELVGICDDLIRKMESSQISANGLTSG